MKKIKKLFLKNAQVFAVLDAYHLRRSFRKEMVKTQCTLKIEYTFIRYIPCMREPSAESVGPPRSPVGGSDNTYTETNRIATGDGNDKCKG